MWGMTHSYARHASFICETWLIHAQDLIHSYVRHDAFLCEAWLVHRWDMTHPCSSPQLKSSTPRIPCRIAKEPYSIAKEIKRFCEYIGLFLDCRRVQGECTSSGVEQTRFLSSTYTFSCESMFSMFSMFSCDNVLMWFPKRWHLNKQSMTRMAQKRQFRPVSFAIE